MWRGLMLRWLAAFVQRFCRPERALLSEAKAERRPGAGELKVSPQGKEISECKVKESGETKSEDGAVFNEAEAEMISCEHQKVKLNGRWVLYRLPRLKEDFSDCSDDDVCPTLARTSSARAASISTASSEGQGSQKIPVAVIFHGKNLAYNEASLFTGGWTAKKTARWGLFNKARTIQALVDHGIAVICPNASFRDNGWYWDSDVGEFANDLKKWPQSGDHAFLKKLFSEIWKSSTGDSIFGPGLDPENVHVLGFSSGAFMASRVAFSPVVLEAVGELRPRSLVICSGGAALGVNSDWEQLRPCLDGHPPTLFLHGGDDHLVPARLSLAYHKELESHGVRSRYVLRASAKHEWLDCSAKEILAWIHKYRT